MKKPVVFAVAFLAMVIFIVLASGVLWPDADPAAEAPETTEEVSPTTEDQINDLEYLAITIYREAGGDDCSDETRIMVGNVVMNRVRSDQFPNTVYEVLTQRGQYAGISDSIVWPDRATSPEEQHAVIRAYDCAQRVINGEQLLPSTVVYQSNYANLGSGIYCYADGLYFNYE